MASIPTNSEIMLLMSRLETNWTELMNNFYDIFFNPNPMIVTLNLVDNQGNVVPSTIPNRAQDMQYILNGNGSPEGNVVGDLGTLYQDLTNGQVYIKQTETSKNGWSLIITEAMLEDIIQQGLGSPEGILVSPKGSLYVDKSVGNLYIKQSSSGSTGWQVVGGTYTFDGDVVLTDGNVDLSDSVKENLLDVYTPTVSTLESFGTIYLNSFGVYLCEPTGNITFSLPTITDNTKFYQILVEMNFTTLYTVNVGTTHYFNENEPEFSANTAYTLIYEYDNLRQVWVCGLLSKS